MDALIVLFPRRRIRSEYDGNICRFQGLFRNSVIKQNSASSVKTVILLQEECLKNKLCNVEMFLIFIVLLTAGRCSYVYTLQVGANHEISRHRLLDLTEGQLNNWTADASSRRRNTYHSVAVGASSPQHICPDILLVSTL